MSPRRPALLVYRPGAIGDALVSLPALDVARHYFGLERTIFAAAGSLEPLFAANGVADLVLSADDPRLVHLFSGDVARLTAALGPIGAAVLWGGESLSVAASALRDRGARVIHSASRPSDPNQHVADYLVSSIDSTSRRRAPTVGLAPSRHDLARIGLQCAETLASPVLALHPGSGSARKNWSPASFARLANLAANRMGLGCVLIAGPADEGLVEQMLPLLEEAPRMITREWPLGRVAALLSGAALYAGNDSGISHLAGCLGVPGVALFGPTSPSSWAPLGGTIQALSQPTMADHTPEDVVEVLANMPKRRQ